LSNINIILDRRSFDKAQDKWEIGDGRSFDKAQDKWEIGGGD